MNTSTADLLRHCKDRSFYAYGTARLFDKRAQSLAFRRLCITFLGVAVPLVVGAVALAFGLESHALSYLVWVAGVVGITQLILSVWSIVARWDEKYAYAVAANQASTKLHNAWSRLIKLPPADLAERIADLDDEDQRQEQSDLTQHISEKEKRFAMCASLLYHQLSCATCKQQPTSMKPGKCDTCGNF